ncbi:MAG: DNA/RNA non-specific endonuclease [Opitutales bacterium]|nr:DNA/RNA non-specific endonuclease [Opitutales bacterium]
MPKRRRRRAKVGTLRQFRKFSFRLFFATVLIVGFGGGAGFLWYQQQDRPTQEKVEHYTLTTLDLLRENNRVPLEVRLVLDFVADRIPLHVGLTVDVSQFEGDSTHIYGGVPESSRNLRILENQGFLLGYDEDRGNPAWVSYRAFQPDSMDATPRPERFTPDNRTRARVHPDLYTNSGFDRGHMAPNFAIAVMHGPEAQEETFLMSNIIPQSPNLNRRVWRDLEQRIIRRYARRFSEVWIITGPIYPEQGKQHLANRVAVPKACFKIIIDEHDNGLRALAFIIPQSVSGNEDPEQFLTSIREIETRTGLNFLSALDPEVQDTLEMHANRRVW